jgi:hypothetical protein
MINTPERTEIYFNVNVENSVWVSKEFQTDPNRQELPTPPEALGGSRAGPQVGQGDRSDPPGRQPAGPAAARREATLAGGRLGPDRTPTPSVDPQKSMGGPAAGWFAQGSPPGLKKVDRRA